jgi:unsaturated chondroitin disaccharide hydrolase
MKINMSVTPRSLERAIGRFFDLSGAKIVRIEKNWKAGQGSPVFTKEGKYTSRGWTEWTQGFQFGSEILQFDATGDAAYLHSGRTNTERSMAVHVTHMGVHDHGFNNISTYGNLLRLMDEGRIEENRWERRYYELALKCSGAVQAHRWSGTADGLGYIYSFNGPHSLFADTIRSLRSLARSHQLGHVLLEEKDMKVDLLGRLIDHARATAKYTVYYGQGRDAFDVRGRVAHESIFNPNDGSYRCPNSQQGYSPFTTWTRGLAWIMCGFAEELEFIDSLGANALRPFGGKPAVITMMLEAARAACDYYIEITPADGIPYWDTGAPMLHKIKQYLDRPADPFNDWEPVDSSAAAIACQGLLRLGHYLGPGRGAGKRYWQAGLTVLGTLLKAPYLSEKAEHEGLILHSVYHRPNGWDHIPRGRKIPCGESSMWGDYHAREAALYVKRMIGKEPYLVFWGTGGRL